MSNPQTVAQLSSQPCRQAITTTIDPLPDGGYQILASCDAVIDPIVCEWHDHLGVMDNHCAAALLLLKALAWDERNHLMIGSVGTEGYVFVQVEPPAPTAPVVEGLEFAVDDIAGSEEVFKTFSAAANAAIANAVATGETVNLDVLTWTEDAAKEWGGDAAVEVYRDDEEASVHERIEIRATSVGRIP